MVVKATLDKPGLLEDSMLESLNITPQDLIGFARQIFPIARSLTGDGVRETLAIMQEHLPELTIHEVPSGTQCLDWTVPEEWNIRDAYVITPDGEKICDFKTNNLHVIGYSKPVNQEISLKDLQAHLHSLPEQPDAIPYVTSYYKRRWGFCISENQRQTLREGIYKVVIDAEHKKGSLTYAELVLPGQSDEEIFLSTYVCHPSMANNEVSGQSVALFLAKHLQNREHRRYTYRFVFIPETIGSIVYLSRHHEHLKKKVVAGFVLTCMGDERCYSFLPSRDGNTLADRAALHVLSHFDPGFIRYSFLDRGSDERQYCSPGVDLPVASIMRSKYGEYPEYHSSLDNFDVVTGDGLYGSFEVLRHCIEALENNKTYRLTTLGEPQLGKRGLYPSYGTRNTKAIVKTMMDLLAYADGTNDLLAIAEKIQTPVWQLYSHVEKLKQNRLIEECRAGDD